MKADRTIPGVPPVTPAREPGHVVETAYKLEEARKTTRWLLAENYETAVEPWRKLVRDLSKRWECSPLEVATRLERAGDGPNNPMLLIAASADVVDESTAAITRSEEGEGGNATQG